jgi:hypothetical protein
VLKSQLTRHSQDLTFTERDALLVNLEDGGFIEIVGPQELSGLIRARALHNPYPTPGGLIKT